MIRFGLIGYGYWGPNLARNFAESRSCELAGISDLNQERLAVARKRHPGVKVGREYKELLDDPQIDAIAIATPVSTHFELALSALRKGKHVLVEKPLTATSDHARILIEEAERRNLVLMVDHTFIYTEAVRKISEQVNSGALGEIYYFDSVRVNLGLFQHDVDVIWDLAVHDLSIFNYLLSERPVAISATGCGHIPGRKENTAYITLFFESSLIGHIHVNWLSPVKVRQTLIGGSRKMIVYDDMHLTEKVRVYDRGITASDTPENMYKVLVEYRMGDILIPHLNNTEALATEVDHFAGCIEKGARPDSDGQAGLEVVGYLEAATQSMKERGKPVELKRARAAA
jgi:predicted dehydrogenase